jgi:uncharacterized protein (TIGR02391 family)
MNTEAKIKLLEAQLAKISELDKAENHETYKAWHKQTGLLLKKILGDESVEAREFHLLDGRTSVFTPDREATNRRNTEAYFSHLRSNRSLLTGLIEFLRSTMDSDDSLPVAPVSAGTLEALHKVIKDKCSSLYLSENYPEAVEKGFKVVRDKLRELTTFETGSDAFGRGGLYIKGATALHVDEDFQQAVKFLTMAIDQFRNEKSHTSDGKIENPVRAYEYLALSSLAMHLLDDVEIKPAGEKLKPAKGGGGKHPEKTSKQQQVTLDPLQVLAMRAFGAMKDYKGLLISYLSGGPALVSPLGEVGDEEITTALNAVDGQEMEANLNQLARWGIVNASSNSNGSPLYTLAKGGYDFLKEHPELNKI